MQDGQCWKQSMEGAFKNYLLTSPHRTEQGTYGPAARKKSQKERYAALNKDVKRP